MNSPSRRLTDLLDEKFGVDNRVYRLPAIPHLTKSPEGGESMDKKRNDTARRSGLKSGVHALLFDNPDREWHLKEVMDAIGHQNLGSVSSCLNEQHRDPKVAISRVGPNTYRVITAGTKPAWVAATARLVPTEAAEALAGDLLEVIGTLAGEVIAADTEGNLLAIKMRVIGRL